MRRGDRLSFVIEEPRSGKKSAQATNVEILDLVDRSRSPSRRRSRSRSRKGGRSPPPRSRSRRSPPRRPSGPPAEKERRPGDWDCPKCGDLQFARNPECRKCGALPRSARDRSDSRRPVRGGNRSPSPRRSAPPRRRSPSPPPRTRSKNPRLSPPPRRSRSPPPRRRSDSRRR
ncbi:unnamed protein product [Polarella glacialis]|uniref:RanBP2-type domain-containing protein n=1 Tax=Polarella glacialis TaxID=89957 RepID=A0A813EUW1_POLGL|nr:unnamed protein product [Polarella glacialis]